jgi:DNA polymerase-4
MGSERLIAHLDCDAFFYSVECLRDPSLVGKAVIVAGSSPRAVVTTASYEARRFGVGSGMPASRARRLCPQALVIPPDGAAYRAKGQEVWELVRERLGRDIQRASIDEAYVDLTGLDAPEEVLRALVAEVEERCGIAISVGLGPSRLVAKVASDADKPRGFLRLSREEAALRFAPEPASLLPGVGPKTAERLLSLGVATVGHLQSASEVSLREAFGARRGGELKARGLFHDDSPVVIERIRKSQSHEHTFDRDVSEMEQMEEVISGLSRRLADDMRAAGRRGRTIGIKVRLDDFTTMTRDRTIERFTDDAEAIEEVALALLRANEPQSPVRLLGVRSSSFEGQVAAPHAARTERPKRDVVRPKKGRRPARHPIGQLRIPGLEPL